MTDSPIQENEAPDRKQRSNAILAVTLFIPVLIIGMILAATILLALGVPATTASVLAAFVGEALAIFTVFAVRRDASTSLKKTLSIRKATIKSVMLGASLGVALYAALLIVSVLLPTEEGYTSDTSAMFFSSTGPEMVFLLFITVPFLAPLFEELALRGSFRNAFATSFKNTRKAEYAAIVVAAILFSLMHFQGLNTVMDLVPLTVSLILGLLAGILAYRSKSIWPSIALHSAYNLTTVLVAVVASSFL